MFCNSIVVTSVELVWRAVNPSNLNLSADDLTSEGFFVVILWDGFVRWTL